MVCAGDISSNSSGRSNADLIIGCHIDLASGLVSFTANNKELPIAYQVTLSSNYILIVMEFSPMENILFQNCIFCITCIFKELDYVDSYLAIKIN